LPQKYERLEYGEGKNKFFAYVELAPTRQIPASEIESVTVQKERKFGRSPDEIQAFEQAVKNSLKGSSPEVKAPTETYPLGFIYSITFKLTSTEWKREVTFTNKHLGERFQLRLGKYDLGLVDFVVPFDAETLKAREFTLFTSEDNASSINKTLAPLGSKVRWK